MALCGRIILYVSFQDGPCRGALALLCLYCRVSPHICILFTGIQHTYLAIRLLDYWQKIFNLPISQHGKIICPHHFDTGYGHVLCFGFRVSRVYLLTHSLSLSLAVLLQQQIWYYKRFDMVCALGLSPSASVIAMTAPLTRKDIRQMWG